MSRIARKPAPTALALVLAAAGLHCLLSRRPAWLCFSGSTGAALARGGAVAGMAFRSSHPSMRRAALQWLRVEESCPEEPSADGQVLPILPMCGIPWPGHQVMLKITDPSHVRMYMDILESGSRRVIVPFCKTRKDGRVRMGEQTEGDRRIHSYGSLLYLTALEDVRERSNGLHRYLATHEVRGRVRIDRLLNPAVLFLDDEAAQFETEYLRGEVDILEEENVSAPNNDGLNTLASWEGIEEAWTELNELSTVLEEPRLQGISAIKEVGPSTWKAAAVWELLRRRLRAHREHAATYGEARAWLREQQKAGLLPEVLPDQLNACKLGMPPALIDKLRRAESESPELSDEHWNPFLKIFAAGDVRLRGRFLRQMICAETRTTRTAVMLKGMLGHATN